MRNLLFIGIGGAIGSILRYVIGNPLNSFYANSFPMGTLLVNGIGSLVIGIIIGLEQRLLIPATWRLFLATGVCGGFTTFSAFSLETVGLLQEQKIGLALFYTGSSLFIGLIACWLGFILTKLV